VTLPVTVPVSAAVSPARPTADALLRGGLGARARADFARAETLLAEAIRTAEATRPLDRHTLASALNAMGLVCKDLARYEEGQAYYGRALAVLRDMPGEQAHEIATLHHNLAGLAHARRDFAAAEPIARRGLAIRAAAAEPLPHAMAADMIALAAILDGLARFDEGERLYLDAIEMLEQPTPDATGSVDFDLAAAFNNLGASYACRERYAEAVACLERAVALKRGVLGARHPDVAVSLHNLAVTTRRLGDRERAGALLGEAEALFVATLGEAHPRTLRCRAQVARWAAST
jgi:tetratricopeptide (TPR) repeat protein